MQTATAKAVAVFSNVGRVALPPPTHCNFAECQTVPSSYETLCHCEEGAARRGNPFSFRPQRGRAMLRIAEDADCQKVNCPNRGKRGHTGVRAAALAMTAVVDSWFFCFALGLHWQLVGGGSAARPTGNGAKTYHQKAKPLKLCINGPDICKKPLTVRRKCAMLIGYKAVMKTRPGENHPERSLVGAMALCMETGGYHF